MMYTKKCCETKSDVFRHLNYMSILKIFRLDVYSALAYGNASRH